MNAVLSVQAPVHEATAMPDAVPDWSVWPLVQALRLRVVVGLDGQGCWTAWTTDASDPMLREMVARRVPHPLVWQTLPDETLDALLAQGEAGYEARDALQAHATEGDAVAEAAVHELSVDAINRQTSPVVRLLDATLFDALKAQASDLHLESTATGMTIRHRLDGVMVEVGDVGSREVAEQLVSRLKVMAELDIGERRLPLCPYS